MPSFTSFALILFSSRNSIPCVPLITLPLSVCGRTSAKLLYVYRPLDYAPFTTVNLVGEGIKGKPIYNFKHV